MWYHFESVQFELHFQTVQSEFHFRCVYVWWTLIKSNVPIHWHSKYLLYPFAHINSFTCIVHIRNCSIVVLYVYCHSHSHWQCAIIVNIDRYLFEILFTFVPHKILNLIKFVCKVIIAFWTQFENVILLHQRLVYKLLLNMRLNLHNFIHRNHNIIITFDRNLFSISLLTNHSSFD